MAAFVLTPLSFQPDRTQCVSTWLADVISKVFSLFLCKINSSYFFLQANTPNFYAKNITEEILDNIDKEGTELTSGTVFKLIEVGPKLSEHWPKPLSKDDSHIGLSLSIIKDFVQITSDLFHQKFAWEEMGAKERKSNATQLFFNNEIIAFR